MLKLFRHDVKCLCQFANFRATVDVNALRKIPSRNRPAKLSEHFQRIGNAAGGENADANAECDGHHRKNTGIPLHLVNAAIGFSAWLLYHHRPVQITDGTVSAKHSDVGIAAAHVEFSSRGYHLHLGASLDEVAHNLQVRHVLPGRISGGSADHEPSLAIHDIWSEAAPVDLLQAADKKLQINHRANHPQKTACVSHRRTYQHHGTGGLSCAHHERFAVVDSSFASRRISA